MPTRRYLRVNISLLNIFNVIGNTSVTIHKEEMPSRKKADAGGKVRFVNRHVGSKAVILCQTMYQVEYTIYFSKVLLNPYSQ